MKHLFIILAVAAFGVFARGGFHGQPKTAADFASAMQSKVGTRIGFGRVAAVAADGDTVVVTFDGPANWREGHQSFMISAPFLEGFCKSGRASDFFQEGRRLRLDTTEGGRNLIRGQVSSRCPAANGV